eukprot:ANDGO_01096.mRNA.1 IWS1-like protein
MSSFDPPAESQNNAADDSFTDEDGKTRKRTATRNEDDARRSKMSRVDESLFSRDDDVDVLDESDDLQASEEANKLLMKMSEAAAEDRAVMEQNLRGQNSSGNAMAVSKLRMLPEVRDTCQKIHLRNALIGQGLLSLFKDWLDPLDEAKELLPSVNVRTVLLDILATFPLRNEIMNEKKLVFQGISLDDVVNSGIGKIVSLLLKHPKETEENKRKALRLKQRIEALLRYETRSGEVAIGVERSRRSKSRQITEDDIASAEAAKERSIREFLKRKSQEEEARVARGESLKEGLTQKAQGRIPKPANFDYVSNVPSAAAADQKTEMGFGTVIPSRFTSDTSKRLMKHMRDNTNTSRSFVHAEKVSVQGRSDVK